MLHKPFYLLSLTLFTIALLNLLWFTGNIRVSELDNLLIGPFFNLALLAIWFYIGLFISVHNHVYYLIPIFIMSINALLLFKNIPVLCDVITGLVLIGVFFYTGFINHHLMKKVSLLGMVYGASIIAVSAAAHLTGMTYLRSFWFIPNIFLCVLLLFMLRKGLMCADTCVSERQHIPVAVEIFKFGLFIAGLSLFLMLGTLGVHELGHSLAANMVGCSHETTFGIGTAMTRVTCDSDVASTFITLNGFILTLIISLLMYFLGNNFARRMSFLLLAFSMLVAIDDFSVLSMPHSILVILGLISTLLIIYGITLIVKNYLLEYETYETSVCSSAVCGKGTYHINNNNHPAK
jgi:hypothetical protein